MNKKLVIVGGVAGGATAAARARRLSEDIQIIMIERGPDIAFANCGLPYHVGGKICQRDALLVQTKEGMQERFNLDIRTEQEVLAIDRDAKTVRVRELETGREYDESYDALLLSPGAAPVRPPIGGVDHPAVFTLRNMVDMDRIKEAVDAGAKRAVVVGGGFIGLEMAENLRRREVEVDLVELLPQVMPPLDPEVAERLHVELRAHGVRLHLEDAAEQFKPAGDGLTVQLRSGATIDTDLVILAVGVRPDTKLAADAGLNLNQRGAIVVDDHMCTNDPAIYAVGDAIQVADPVLGGETMIPLAGPANRQARIAADNILGRDSTYRGTQGTSVVGLFGVTAGSTGASEKTLRQREIPFKKIYVHRGQHAGYYPGAEMIMLKLLFTPDDGRVLGAQVVGSAGVDKRIDVIAMAIQARMTVHDLEEVELAYAPQYGSAKDAVNIAGFVAANALNGDEKFIYAEELPPNAPETANWTLLDVRSPLEFETGHIPGALNIPLPELRTRWKELPAGKPVASYCGVGQRAYYANRILRTHGIDCTNIAGGLMTYSLVHPSEK